MQLARWVTAIRQSMGRGSKIRILQSSSLPLRRPPSNLVVPNTHPGPQKLLRKTWVATTGLRTLAWSSGIICMQSFIHANFTYRSWVLSKFWALDIMDVGDSLVLFLTALGVVIAREQYVASLRPVINYECIQGLSPE